MRYNNFMTAKTTKLSLRFFPIFLVLVVFLLMNKSVFSQNVGINDSGASPDTSAGLDVDFDNKGFLIPRLTTAQRDLIQNPARGLQIYNLDCDNFNYFNGTSWVNLNPIVSSINISPDISGPICSGTEVTFTATTVNEGSSPIYQWKLNGVNAGTNSNIFASTSFSNGDQIKCELISSDDNQCLSNNFATSNVAFITVHTPPTIADAGPDQDLCGENETILAANTPVTGTGTWTVVSGTATITDPNSPTSTVTGLSAPGSTLRWTISSNPPCSDSYDEVTISVFTSITDVRDNNVYQTVKIGNQCWMKENLKYLPSVSDETSGTKTDPYYYVYGYNGTDVNDAKNEANYSTYGVLYNWPAAMDGVLVSSNSNPSGVQGVCPNGWHLPSESEWQQLETHLGLPSVSLDVINWRGTDEGGKLKETGFTHWGSPNANATNSSVFTALPGGSRSFSAYSFGSIGVLGTWWTATSNGTQANARRLSKDEGGIFRSTNMGRDNGFSVRCIKD